MYRREGVVLTFNSLDIESTWDALYIHDGDSNSAPIFDSGNPATQAGFPAGGYYGTTAPGPFTAKNETGCLTLRFRSDTFVTGDGWDVDISCTPCAIEVFRTDASGYGTLKNQIECADPVDVIVIGDAILGDTIELEAPIPIDKELDIDPGNGNIITVQSDTNGPIFNIMGTGNLDLFRMNLLSGQTDPGGAIINNGILLLNNVNIFENGANPNPNGLIQNNGQLTIQGSTNIRK